MLWAEDLSNNRLVDHLIEPAFDFLFNFLSAFPNGSLSSPEIRRSVFRLSLVDILHRHDDKLILGLVIKLNIAETSANLTTVKRVIDSKFIGLDGLPMRLFYRSERVIGINKFNRDRNRLVQCILFGNKPDTVVSFH